jgi:hypothetical protein
MRIKKYILSLIIISSFFSCGKRSEESSKGELEIKMNKIAENYVKLVLQVGLFNPDYVDAYYGP